MEPDGEDDTPLPLRRQPLSAMPPKSATDAATSLPVDLEVSASSADGNERTVRAARERAKQESGGNLPPAVSHLFAVLSCADSSSQEIWSAAATAQQAGCSEWLVEFARNRSHRHERRHVRA